MADDDINPERSAEDSRLTSLEARVGQAEAAEAERTKTGAVATDANYRLGNRVLAELLGGMIGGALFGWLIDRFAGTSPWGLLGMLFLGIIVAFRNIIRISGARPKQ